MELFSGVETGMKFYFKKRGKFCLFYYQSVKYFWKRSFYVNICAVGFSFIKSE